MAEQTSTLEEIARMRASTLVPKPEYQDVLVEGRVHEKSLTEVGDEDEVDANKRIAVRLAM
ncbi:MAG TPA: hypothetical protein VNU01_13160 [Egibacteraceae bacterium]|nr:hypothetical protein [Egibacteraceae bacterium]